MQDAEIELVLIRQMPHTGDKSLLKGAVVGPSGEDFVDGRVMDGSMTVGVFGYGQALPLHPRVQQPQYEVEDAMIAQFALRSTLRHREVR